MTSTEMQAESFTRATQGTSAANYATIFSEFTARGIPADQIQPRENVFTFNAWKALGRHVRKGEHGVKVVTWIPIAEKRDATSGEVIRAAGKRPKVAVVFHVSQTDPD